MKKEQEQNAELNREIRALQREIAELSALLALRKLETEHPALHKFVSDAQRSGDAVRAKAERVYNFGQQHLPRKLQNIFGGILILGVLGSALAYIFGPAASDRHK